ncbi:MAG: protein kinase [Myxococcota bacterium]|nr:protein kinase [Myxococcota bacterium]
MKYILEGMLGEGGMAVVYRARHRDLDSLHAIKKLKVRDERIRKRLVLEGKVLSQLRHPNILSVTDLIDIEGCPALVMEFINGPTLSDFMTHQKLSIEQCDAFARGILKGMAAAHSQGMIHRDLKPGNILVAVTEDELIPKISDFGLAKVMEGPGNDHQMTQTGVTMGTPAYMAPEQIKDFRSVDTRADVFALGTILYELLLGDLCFSGDNLMEIWEKICKGEFTPPQDKNPNLPQRMIDAINAALEIDADKRPSTAQELYAIWCTDETGQQAPIVGHQTLTFWPSELRTQAAAMGNNVVEEQLTIELNSEEQRIIQNGHLDFKPLGDTPKLLDQTDPPLGRNRPLTAAEADRWALPTMESHAPVMTVDSEDPPLQGYEPNDLLPEEVPNENKPVPQNTKGNAYIWIGLMVMLFIMASVIFLISTNRQNSSLEGVNPSSTAAGNPIFQLSATTSSETKNTFDEGYDALLKGEYARAEQLLTPLKTSHPDEAAIYSLLSTIHVLRGNAHLSSHAAQQASQRVQVTNADLATVVRLSHKSHRASEDVSISSEWGEALEKYQDPIVDLNYLVSMRARLGKRAFLYEVRRLLPKRPSIPLASLEVLALKDLRDYEQALERAEHYSVRYPDSIVFSLDIAEIQLRQGKTDLATKNLKRIVLQDETFVDARILLAEIYASQNNETARMGEFMTSLSDTVPNFDQTNFMLHHSISMYNQGRLATSHKLSDFCVREADDANQRLACAGTALEGQTWLLPTEKWDTWIELTTQLLADPALDSDLQKTYALELQRIKALKAARDVDLDTLEKIQSGIQRISPKHFLPKEYADLQRELYLEIALLTKNQQMLNSLIAELSTVDEFAPAGTCSVSLQEARIHDGMGQTESMMQSLDKIVRETCIPTQNRILIQQLARIWMAEIHYAQEDVPKAQALLNDFQIAWPEPDVSILLDRARALQDRINGKKSEDPDP